MNSISSSLLVRRLHACRLLSVLISCLVGSAAAFAQTVVLNTLSSSVFGGVAIDNTLYKAQPFATPSSGSYSLVSVSLGMANNSPAASGTFTVSIMQGDIGVGPDDSLPIITLTGNAAPTTAGTYIYTAGGEILSANTTYWIVASVPAGTGAGRYRWNAASGDTYQTATWTPVDAFAQSVNSGADWTVLTGTNANPYLFSLSVTAVPEPSTYALLAGVAVLGLAIARRRQTRT